MAKRISFVYPHDSARNQKIQKQKIPAGDLLSHPVTRAVPLARDGLTSLFGMGRGVTRPLWSARNFLDSCFAIHDLKSLTINNQ